MQRVNDFLKKAGTYYLATVEGDQPRVRPFGTVNIFDGKLYIQTGKIKPTAKQIAENPKVELCAMADGEWIRVSGTLVEDDRFEAKKSINLPVKVKNVKNPGGFTCVDGKFYTNISSWELYKGDVASQSDILEFKYDDASKLDKYGDNVPELEKDTEWHFGNDYSFLSEEDQKIQDGESVFPERKIKSVDEEGKPNEYEDNTEFSLADFGDIPIGESFIPNFPMSLFDVSGYDDPIAKYVASVTATNAGNYGVLYEYTVNIVNIGTAKKIQYTIGNFGNHGCSAEWINKNNSAEDTDCVLTTEDMNSDGSAALTFDMQSNQEYILKLYVQNYASYGGEQTNQLQVLN